MRGRRCDNDPANACCCRRATFSLAAHLSDRCLSCRLSDGRGHADVLDAVAKSLGQTILVENRPGGGGIIGAQNLKQATPDGHTLLSLSNGPLTTAQWMRSLPYDASKDFEPVAMLFGFSQFLTVFTESPVTSVRELMDFAKKRQGGLTYSTLGVGSITHFLCALVARESGMAMSHIPYTTLSQYLLDIATNRVDFTFSSYQQARALEQDKKVRFLATTAPTRSPLRPNVPTTAELGLPELNLGLWIALLAPAGTPPATVQRLSEHFAKAALDPHIVDRLLREDISGKVVGQGSDRFRKRADGRFGQAFRDQAGLDSLPAMLEMNRIGRRSPMCRRESQASSMTVVCRHRRGS